MSSRIYLGIPCGEDMKSRTGLACMNLIAYSYSRGQVVIPEGCWGGDTSQNQNLLVANALKLKATHILLIETDMLFPPTALEQLLKHRVDIVGCLYRFKEPPNSLMLW